ncbi:MAG: hypothetical protein HY653_05485 [Acidobacteria bacterium]|nr:hypothetical protein [Acidobacteriota bacterium]
MESYQEEKRGKGPAPPKPAGGLGPKTPLLPDTRRVSRCAQCGTVLAATALVEPLGPCLKCGAALHSCKQCVHFDPAGRFECAQPIPERIADKAAHNACTLFSLRTTVERETSSSSRRPDDARRAFENLFKK